MQKILFITVLLLSQLGAQQTDTLFILQTTDIHGRIYPYDYFTDEPDEMGGLAKIYSRVKEYRTKHKNVILLDSGDLLQGTPLAYFFNQNDRHLVHPLILTMNYMGYDAFAVGNHDIEQGVFVYEQARTNSNFEWLSANAVMEDERTYFKPYTILSRSGIKIGVLGLTTPGIPMWLDESLYPGITWKDMQQTAETYAKEVKRQSDVFVGIFHAGFNAGYSREQTEKAGIPNENASGIVAENIKEFDVVLAGHSHRAGIMVPGKENEMVFKDGPVKLNAGYWGRNLGVVKIILQKKNDKWHIKHKSAWLEPMKFIKPAKSILQLTEYYHKKTLTYIRTELGTVSGTLDAADARFKDNAVIELINNAQIAHTGADISFAASFNDRFTLNSGPVKIKDIYGMYRYENFLYVVEMTGRQIKDFLEYSARYFVLKDGQVQANPEIAGYNYDMAEGVNYQIDVSREPGKRIVNMTTPGTNRSFDLEKKYKVALNSYRASGGGGHMAAAGAQDNPVVFKSNLEMRNILIEYIKKKKTIDPSVNKNWRLTGF